MSKANKNFVSNAKISKILTKTRYCICCLLDRRANQAVARLSLERKVQVLNPGLIKYDPELQGLVYVATFC